MRKLPGTLAALAIGGTMMLGGHLSTFAQDATPVAPNPSECVVAPITSTTAIVALWNGED